MHYFCIIFTSRNEIDSFIAKNMKSSEVPETVSHYRILKKLGAGGMGEVFLAEDTRLNRKVAVKFLPSDLAADERAKKRLLREA